MLRTRRCRHRTPPRHACLIAPSHKTRNVMSHDLVISGYLRVGKYAEKGADAPECPPGSAGVGNNVSAKSAGALALGNSDRKGGLVAKGPGATTMANSVNSSTVSAEGAGASARGEAIGYSRIEARGASARSSGSAHNNSVLEAEGQVAEVHGVASDESKISAKGANVRARGRAANSGVIQAEGERLRVDATCDGGLAQVKGVENSLLAFLGQRKKVKVSGSQNRVRASLPADEASPQAAIFAIDGHAISARLSGSGTLGVDARNSDLDLNMHGGELELRLASSRLSAWYLPDDVLRIERPYGDLRGRNIAMSPMYGSGIGESGCLDGVLPSWGLFAGLDSTSEPAVSLVAHARGATPLGGGIAHSWEASSGLKERFEWVDGNLTAEDRDAYFVEVQDGKIAKGGPDSVGVSSSAGGFVGSRALSVKTDRLGRPILTPDFAFGLNALLISKRMAPHTSNRIPAEKLPAFLQAYGLSEDTEVASSLLAEPSSVEQKPKRQLVTLLGRAVVRDDGKCDVGARCTAEGGLAVPGDRWHVLRRISAIAVEILFR